MFVAAFFFSVMSMLVKLVGERIPSQEIVLARNAFALVITWYLIKNAGISPWGNNRKLLVVRGIFGFCALTCFYWSVTHIPLADATVIQYSNPVFAAILAALILKEPFSRREMLGAFLSLAGVVVLAQPSFLFGGGSRLTALHLAVALGGAIMSAAAYVTIRELRKTDDALVVVFYFPLIALPASIPTAAPSAVWPVGMEWALLVAIGITTQLGQVYMTKGLHLESTGRATAVSYVQVLFAFVWGMAFFAEPVTVPALLGAVLIVVGTGIVTLKRAPAAEEPGNDRPPTT